MRSVVYENAAKVLPAALRVFVSLNCSSALNPFLIGVDPLVHCFIGESSLRSQPSYHRDTLKKPYIAYVLSGYPKKAMGNTLDRAGYGVLVSEIDKEEIG